MLAAGAGCRMGRLKQLLPYAGGTLLDHSVDQALAAGFSPLVVVVGAEADRIRASLRSSEIQFAENQNWEMGMGSSITTGLRALQHMRPEVAAVCITLADQPLVTSVHLRSMADELFRSHADVVAGQYRNTLGAPAIFSKPTLPSLRNLSPEAGAKKLFYNSAWNIQPFALPEGASDIDTPEDFARLSNAKT